MISEKKAQKVLLGLQEHASHDQGDHGNWARGMRHGPKRVRKKKSTPDDKPTQKKLSKVKNKGQDFTSLTEQKALSQYKTWAAELSDTEKETIRDYRIHKYKEINKGLRDGSLTERGDVDKLDQIISKGILESDTELYRGASIEALGGEANLFIGSTFLDKGYTSTSLSRLNAARFANFATDKGQTPVFITIRAPKGTQGVYLESLGDYQGEQEMLLSRDNKYQITNINEITKQVYGIDRTFKHVVVDLIHE